MSTTNLTLYFLNSSRAIRTAWLLQELGLEYDLVAADRAPNGLAPPEFKSKIPDSLGKSPTIHDGDVIMNESGAIAEYLCDKYDTKGKLLPRGDDLPDRGQVIQWLHAAEATFMVHAIAIIYTRWHLPEIAKDALPAMEKAMSKNIHNDLNWLEGQLKAQKEKGSDWIVGERLSIADIQMQFAIEFIFERKLGNDGPGNGQWPLVEAWLKRTKARDAYQKTVERTGYTLKGSFKQ